MIKTAGFAVRLVMAGTVCVLKLYVLLNTCCISFMDRNCYFLVIVALKSFLKCGEVQFGLLTVKIDVKLAAVLWARVKPGFIEKMHGMLLHD